MAGKYLIFLDAILMQATLKKGNGLELKCSKCLIGNYSPRIKWENAEKF